MTDAQRNRLFLAAAIMVDFLVGAACCFKNWEYFQYWCTINVAVLVYEVFLVDKKDRSPKDDIATLTAFIYLICTAAVAAWLMLHGWNPPKG